MCIYVTVYAFVHIHICVSISIFVCLYFYLYFLSPPFQLLSIFYITGTLYLFIHSYGKKISTFSKYWGEFCEKLCR